MSERAEILKEADRLTHKDRDAIYGDPLIGMRCAAEIKAIYRRYSKDRLAIEHDEAIERQIEKLARIATGQFHRDNYVDGAAYLAMAYENQSRKMLEMGPLELERALDDGVISIKQVMRLEEKKNQQNRAHDYLELNTSDASARKNTSLDNSENGPRHTPVTQKSGSGE